MSVTIYLADQQQYANATNSWVLETYECYCEGENPDCYECEGTGKVSFKRAPATEEMNISNGNFAMLCSVLGFDDENLYGEIEPAELARLIYECDPSLGVRGENTGLGSAGCRYIDCGCSQEQFESYLERLRHMVFVATARKTSIRWS